MSNWPTLFEFLPKDLPQLNKFIVLRAVQDLGVVEMPPSSNRGPRIDEFNQRAGSPVGSFWCASFTTAVWEDCSATVPEKDRASCDVLVAWAIREKLWTPYDPTAKKIPDQVREGSMIVYTNGEHLRGTDRLDAVHVGILVRKEPYLLSIEGNAAFGGTFSNNGEAVVFKRVDPRRIYGFISPKLHS